MPRNTTAPLQQTPLQPADFWRWAWSAARPVFATLGFLLLVLAYLGVSSEVLVAKQLPYLVSGGLTGLAFITLGSRLLLIEDLRRDSGRLDRLEGMVEELHLALLTRPDSPLPHQEPAADNVSTSPPGRLPSSRSKSAVPPEPGVLVLPRGSSFHRNDCTIVAGKASDALPAATARDRGLHACRLCQPLAVG